MGKETAFVDFDPFTYDVEEFLIEHGLEMLASFKVPLVQRAEPIGPRERYECSRFCGAPVDLRGVVVLDFLGREHERLRRDEAKVPPEVADCPSNRVIGNRWPLSVRYPAADVLRRG